MSNYKRKVVFFILCAWANFAFCVDANLASGMERYSKGDFSSSILYFQKAVDASGGKNEDAQYWLTMALASDKKYRNALAEAKRFLALYPKSTKTPEMLYQKGRLECAVGNYDYAISTLYDFIKRYPDDKAIASAYFWIGECLYSTSHFDEARTIFSVVLLDYPDSAKVEAAKYKLALIDQAATQTELLRLLKLSNDETLRLSQELERLKAELSQAQTKLQSAGSSKLDGNRLAELEQYLIDERRKNAELYDKITLLQMKNDELTTMIANFANASYLDKPAETTTTTTEVSVPVPAPSVTVTTPPVEPQPVAPVVEAPKEPSEEELKRRAALEELLRKAGLLKTMYDEVLDGEKGE